jgi:hypothetical protein
MRAAAKPQWNKARPRCLERRRRHPDQLRPKGGCGGHAWGYSGGTPDSDEANRADEGGRDGSHVVMLTCGDEGCDKDNKLGGVRADNDDDAHGRVSSRERGVVRRPGKEGVPCSGMVTMEA